MRLRLRSVFVPVVAAALAGAAAPAAAAATPPAARSTDHACPAGHVPSAGFTDVVAGSVHAPNIDCAVWWRVAQGRSTSVYDPAGRVTRDQMASFVARLVRRSGGTLPADPPDAFTDDEGDVHEPDIDALAAVHIVEGTGDRLYAPGRTVTRGEMAAFLVRAFEYRSGQSLPAGDDYFPDDDGTTFEAQIDTAAAAGFTGGYPDGTYRPAVAVPRDEMATFLARVLDLAVADGLATPPPTGYDVSYPQCGQPLPTNVAFGVVGVNGGRPLLANPCLGTGDGPSELAWAEAAGAPVAFYANTADPGPQYSQAWPTGRTVTADGTAHACSADQPNSTDCSFVYGWTMAKDSFADAVAAEQQAHGSDAGAAAGAAAAAAWWLDVETVNSWQTQESAYGDTPAARANDLAALQGGLAALHDAGVATAGLYSTAAQWTAVTGGSGQLPSAPVWVAGAGPITGAQQACAQPGFSGGPVRLAQFRVDGFDADYPCG